VLWNNCFFLSRPVTSFFVNVTHENNKSHTALVSPTILAIFLDSKPMQILFVGVRAFVFYRSLFLIRLLFAYISFSCTVYPSLLFLFRHVLLSEIHFVSDFPDSILMPGISYPEVGAPTSSGWRRILPSPPGALFQKSSLCVTKALPLSPTFWSSDFVPNGAHCFASILPMSVLESAAVSFP